MTTHHGVYKAESTYVAENPHCVILPDLFSASSKSRSESACSLETEDTSISCEPYSPFTPPRSIFKPYWEKTGDSARLIQPPLISLGEPALPPPISKLLLEEGDAKDSQTSNLSRTEETPSREENGCTSLPLTPRRSIFGPSKELSSEQRLDQGLPLLPAEKELRKASSLGALSRHREGIPLTPCLKPSSSFASRRKLSEGSVKFSEAIQVRVYSPFLEKHAGKGWLKWFAP